MRDLARDVARGRYVEGRLFEILGTWATEVDDPDVARVAATQSRHHGEHAEWFAAIAPVLHDLDPAELSPPAALVDYLDAVAAAGATVERLSALVEVVLPELTSRYEATLAACADVADAPLRRVLRFVLVEIGDDWRAARDLLHGGLRSDDEAAVMAAHQSHLQALARVAR